VAYEGGQAGRVQTGGERRGLVGHVVQQGQGRCLSRRMDGLELFTKYKRGHMTMNTLLSEVIYHAFTSAPLYQSAHDILYAFICIFFSLHGMPAPRAMCFAYVNLFLFNLCFNDPFIKATSGSTRLIFPKISPYGGYSIVDYQTDHLFPIAQGMLPWQPILGLKWAKSRSFVVLAFPNGVEYRNSDFKRFICNDLATLYKNLANCGPVTPEFKRGKDVHPLVDQQFGYLCLVAPLLDLVGISTEFCKGISTQFCFSYLLWGVTAMPSRLHASLCQILVPQSYL